MTNATGSLLDRFERALPRTLAERVALTRRDVAMVLEGLAGRQPSPLVRRRSSPREALPASAALSTRTVRVREVIRETPDAVSLVLEDPSGSGFRFEAGQFFTVCATVDGVALRRAYSASRPSGDTLRITVKRVPGGAMSTHLNETLREGDTLDLLGPSGTFTATPSPERRRHLVLLGGGSGVTPLLSIASAVLRDEPASRVSLVYGNRSWSDVILRDELGALASEHPARFTLRHVLQRGHEGFVGAEGILDDDTTSRELDELDLADDAPVEFFVCGPEPMRAAARRALVARGVDPATVREEVYTSPRRSGPNERSSQVVTLRLKGETRDVVVRGGETILEAATREGVEMPFSCTVGGCGACQCKRVEGTVAMEEPNCLRADERAAGAVLTCIGRPRGRVVLEVP